MGKILSEIIVLSDLCIGTTPNGRARLLRQIQDLLQGLCDRLRPGDVNEETVLAIRNLIDKATYA